MSMGMGNTHFYIKKNRYEDGDEYLHIHLRLVFIHYKKIIK